MQHDFDAVFQALKALLAAGARKLSVKTDEPAEYVLETKVPSPFPQHKGKPLFFAAVKIGKSYVSFHFLPVYMCAPLQQKISPELKKRMQGKGCFNFKTVPDTVPLRDLKQLVATGLEDWKVRRWL